MIFVETIKIKHREYEIVETTSNNSLIVARKNKKFFVRSFSPRSDEANELTYALEKISTSGVKSPKLIAIDRKNGFAVSEYIDGQLMTDYLSSNDMTDPLYEQLFKNAYYAKLNHMTLAYEPDKWMIYNNELYYIYPMFIIYQKEKDLAEKYIRLWFNTKELANFMANCGVSYDKSRIKDDFSTNKSIVLTTCKYYR